MHVLIPGMTLSGKTTLALRLAAHYKRANVGVLVLDPLQDPRWQCDFQTADAEEFLDVLWRSKSCMAFIDESGDTVGRYNDTMTQTATQGRHWGHTMHYCVHRVTQLSLVLRDQCTRLYLFSSGVKQGELLAEEWNRPELEQCNKLAVGEYFYAVKMGEISRHQLFSEESKNADSANRPGVGHHGDRGRGRGSKDKAPEGGGERVGDPDTPQKSG